MCRNYIYKKRKKCISHHRRRRQQCHCTHLKRMPANAFIFGFRELFKLCITFHLLPFAIPIDDPIAFILSFSRKKNNINTHLQWFSWNLSTFFLSEFFFPIFLPSQLHIKRSIIIFFRQNIFIKTRISLVIDLFFWILSMLFFNWCQWGTVRFHNCKIHCQRLISCDRTIILDEKKTLGIIFKW